MKFLVGEWRRQRILQRVSCTVEKRRGVNSEALLGLKSSIHDFFSLGARELPMRDLILKIGEGV